MVLMSGEIDYGKRTDETHNGVPVYETEGLYLVSHEFAIRCAVSVGVQQVTIDTCRRPVLLNVNYKCFLSPQYEAEWLAKQELNTWLTTGDERRHT